MSHVSTNTSTLNAVNNELLKTTLNLVAKKHGGKVSRTISDFYGKELDEWNGSKMLGAVKTSTVKRGVGLIMKNGQLHFVGDSYGAESHFAQLRQDIESTYTKLALIAALSQEGFEVNIETVDLGTLIQGVAS